MRQLIRDMLDTAPLPPSHPAWRRIEERNARRELGDFLLATALGAGLATVFWAAWMWGAS